MKVTCDKCQHEFNVSTKELNSYGFVINSKGDFISSLIKTKITFNDLLLKTTEKYPQSNNVHRILRVINEMKRNNFIYEDKGFIILNKTSK